MSYFTESIRQLVGLQAPKVAPERYTPEVKKVHLLKREEAKNKERQAEIFVEREKSSHHHKWRNRRWATLIVVNVLFVVSYAFDVQLLEGALTASRFVGFHMADLNAALQVMVAYKHVVLNLLIGTVTVALLWWLLGGRSFCSWVCPYHLLAEWAEKIHRWLADRHLAVDIKFHRGVRPAFYVLFLVLTAVTGYTIFETISATGILSRALIYGPGLALAWVGALLLFEIFVSRRAWCRYVCPIGITYGLVGSVSPLRVHFNLDHCYHHGDCRKVCMVPHVLDATILGKAATVESDIGADCTRCGLCIDTCPSGALRFEFKGLKGLT